MNPNEWLSRVAKDPEVTPTQLAIATALWSYMDRHGTCFPGMQTIGERAGIRTRDTVRSAVARLEELGHLTISIQPRGRLSTNQYKAVDKSSRPPTKPVTAVTRLVDRRPPTKPVTQGPPRNQSQSFPEGTKGGTGTHPVISYIAETTRL